MIQGFVTMATGDERYYRMAVHLLRSYKFFTKNPYRFAIIADRENEYTAEFDDVVILDNAQRSYMDKVRLLETCPYDENIFIDADCLAYDDLNIYWSAFDGAPDFSVFGKALPLDSQEGWFKCNGAGKYKDSIHFVTHLHGVIYFIRPGKTCSKMLKLCYELIDSYDQFNIPYFPTPADESVFALAIAIMNLKPTDRFPEYYIFLPVAEVILADISEGKLEYKNPYDSYVSHGILVHWANVNTQKALYKKEIVQLDCLVNNQSIDRVKIQQMYTKWKKEDSRMEKALERKKRIGNLKSRVYGVLRNGK